MHRLSIHLRENMTENEQVLRQKYGHYLEKVGQLLDFATAERLREMRKDMRLDTKELAVFLGVGNSYVLNIESGRQPVTILYISRLIRFIKERQQADSKVPESNRK